MRFESAPLEADYRRLGAIQFAAPALAAVMAMAFSCPAVAAAGIVAMPRGHSATVSPLIRSALVLLCATALVAAFIIPHEPPRWVMLGFGLCALGAGLAATLVGLTLGVRGAAGSMTPGLVLVVSGTVMAISPAGWICVAALVGVLSWTAFDTVRALPHQAMRP